LNSDQNIWLTFKDHAHLETGDYAQAIKDFSKAIELDPDYAVAYNNRGLAYYNSGDFEQAIFHGYAADGVEPTDGGLWRIYLKSC